MAQIASLGPPMPVCAFQCIDRMQRASIGAALDAYCLPGGFSASESRSSSCDGGGSGSGRGGIGMGSSGRG
jgi:hypothetical protein